MPLSRKDHLPAIVHLVVKHGSRSYAQICSYLRTGDSDAVETDLKRGRRAGLLESRRVPRPRWFPTKKARDRVRRSRSRIASLLVD